MMVYSIIAFVMAVVFLAIGIAIYQGNTKLIHDYHQTHIKESERQEYGRDFAKGMFAGLIVSIIIANRNLAETRLRHERYIIINEGK